MYFWLFSPFVLKQLRFSALVNTLRGQSLITVTFTVQQEATSRSSKIARTIPKIIVSEKFIKSVELGPKLIKLGSRCFR